jgi:hypothetical protein
MHRQLKGDNSYLGQKQKQSGKNKKKPRGKKKLNRYGLPVLYGGKNTYRKKNIGKQQKYRAQKPLGYEKKKEGSNVKKEGKVGKLGQKQPPVLGVGYDLIHSTNEH